MTVAVTKIGDPLVHCVSAPLPTSGIVSRSLCSRLPSEYACRHAPLASTDFGGHSHRVPLRERRGSGPFIAGRPFRRGVLEVRIDGNRYVLLRAAGVRPILRLLQTD